MMDSTTASCEIVAMGASSTIRPSVSTVMQSQTAKTSSNLWSTMTIATSCSRAMRCSVTIGFEVAPRRLPHHFFVQDAAGRNLAGEEEVLRNGEVFQQRQLLENAGYACLGRGGRAREGDRPPIEQDLPAVGHRGAGENFQQGRLTCAVVAYQTMNLTGVEGEDHAVQHSRSAVALDEARATSRSSAILPSAPAVQPSSPAGGVRPYWKTAMGRKTLAFTGLPSR